MPATLIHCRRSAVACSVHSPRSICRGEKRQPILGVHSSAALSREAQRPGTAAWAARPLAGGSPPRLLVAGGFGLSGGRLWRSAPGSYSHVCLRIAPRTAVVSCASLECIAVHACFKHVGMWFVVHAALRNTAAPKSTAGLGAGGYARAKWRWAASTARMQHAPAAGI